jgi:hypothetical protein
MKIAAIPRWARWLLLGLAGAGIVMATGSGSDVSGPARPEGKNQVRPASRPAMGGGEKAPPQAMPRLELERLVAPDKVPDKAPEGEVGNVFAATSWYVPPPPPPPPPPTPPPKPTAPPMPFAYLGSYDGEARLIIILAKGDRVYTVSPGDVIEGTYKVESIKGAWLEMIYLPLNIKQTINTGGA